MQHNTGSTTTNIAPLNMPASGGNSYASSPNENDDSQFQRALKYLIEPFSAYEKNMFKVMLGITFVVVISFVLPTDLLLKILYKLIVILFYAAIMLTIWLYCHVETDHRNDFINRFVDVVMLTVDKFQNDFINVVGNGGKEGKKETPYIFKF